MQAKLFQFNEAIRNEIVSVAFVYFPSINEYREHQSAYIVAGAKSRGN